MTRTGGAAPSPSPYPPHWEFDVVLADGGTVHIRPILPSDADAYLAFFERLSAETRYYRFFGPKPSLSPAEVARFTTVDFRDRMALVAWAGDDMVAVARYDRLPDGDAEVAFTIDDAQQGRGLGTLMLEYLAASGRENGVERFVAETLPGNARMLSVFRDAGYQAVDHFADGVVQVEFPIAATDTAREVVERREHRAEARSIDRILRPKSVAVIGASSRHGTVGHQLFVNLLAGEFAGPVYPVNDHAPHVASVPAYPSVLDVPGEVDLAVVVVPAAAVAGVVEQCGEKGVKGLVVVSAGFSDSGPEGEAMQAEVLNAARRGGMRMVGPNCLGVANTAIGLNATFAPRRPPVGRVGFLSQSGALGIAVLDRASELGIGISSFAALGDKADVSGNDLLQYWEDDPATDVVLLYLESFGNPRKFGRIARRVSRRKPIVAVKSGRSATAGGAEAAVDALFRQAGVTRVDTLDQLFDVGQVLESQPLPRGDRVAVVSNGGGPAILAADACGGVGLRIAGLADATRAALTGVLGPRIKVDGPVVLEAAAPPAHYEHAVRLVLADPGVDALVVIHTPPVERLAGDVAQAVGRGAAGADVPVVAAFLAAGGALAPLAGADGTGRIPVFGSPEPAVIALGRVARYAAWRRRDPGEVPALTDIDRAGARELVAEVLEQGDSGWLDERRTSRLLDCYGIARTPEAGGLAEPGGLATAVALSQDPAFGPVVGLGIGGVETALLADRAFRIVPLTDRDASELVRALHASPLLFGHGGREPLAVELLEDLLVRVGLLADDLPEVAELDLNPVVVGPRGVVVAGARVRVEPARPTADELVRRLRT